MAFIKNGVKNIRIDKKTHTLKIYFALCGSPSDLAFVEKIKSPKVLIKNQKTIENPMTHKREIPIFFFFFTHQLFDFKKPYSFGFI